ncbi:MAG: hypothetical protein ACM3UY_09775 [Methanocella sp.]|jgi:hypothetical protein
MADPFKRLRHQIDRKRRHSYYRNHRVDQLLDLAYHGLTEQPIWQKENPSEWLNKL